MIKMAQEFAFVSLLAGGPRHYISSSYVDTLDEMYCHLTIGNV